MNNFISRSFSFFLACALSSLILLMPQAFTNEENTVNHSLLMLLLIGIMIGFIHGIGFQAKSRLLGFIFSPMICWPIMLGGLFIILNKTGVFA